MPRTNFQVGQFGTPQGTAMFKMPHFKLVGEETITRYLTTDEMLNIFPNLTEWPSHALKLLSKGKFYPKKETPLP